MAFNELIRWPESLDVFPSLEDNTGGSIQESQIVYAQHYNKIRNCVLKMQDYLTGDTVASGDGTVKGITTQVQITVPLSVLARVYAYPLYDPSIIIPAYPGNVLPFEFIFASTFDSMFYALEDSGYRVYERRTSLSELNDILSGLTFLDVYQVSVSIWDRAYHFSSLWTVPAPYPTPRKFVTNHTTMKDTEGMLVKGCIIDYGSSTPDNVPWHTYDDIFLVCSVFGVKAA